ncbi:hypothetical protein PPERSA_00729 [Pseudocohnilembus persalinus]|uniref:Transmembrane protein n=1 Tax=Pseudocohnilembus persalinus TaxID=266149 RepID=A0A0V0R4Y5_PSEPJ|nr:hypothetical protein PPERSA_00729 [Pseudocohnilembus persalinus]|eukprot:KRX09450.1 hypothetical protein PPERSA_00729 [Pseudocohnilembus persalinus]
MQGSFFIFYAIFMMIYLLLDFHNQVEHKTIPYFIIFGISIPLLQFMGQVCLNFEVRPRQINKKQQYIITFIFNCALMALEIFVFMLDQKIFGNNQYEGDGNSLGLLIIGIFYWFLFIGYLISLSILTCINLGSQSLLMKKYDYSNLDLIAQFISGITIWNLFFIIFIIIGSNFNDYGIFEQLCYVFSIFDLVAIVVGLIIQLLHNGFFNVYFSHRQENFWHQQLRK